MEILSDIAYLANKSAMLLPTWDGIHWKTTFFPKDTNTIPRHCPI